MAKLLNDKNLWGLLTEDEQAAIGKAVNTKMTIDLPDLPEHWGTNKKGKITNIDTYANTITVDIVGSGVFGSKVARTYYIIPIQSLFYDKRNPPLENQRYRLNRLSFSVSGFSSGDPLGGGYRKTKSLHKKSNKPKKNRTRRRKY
jgi:hypothetical protein